MKVVLVQSSWTPHSEARLRIARDRFAAGGGSLEVVTVAATQSDYGWPVPAPESSSLFTGKDYWNIGYRELKSRLIPTLEACCPDVVVLPGWAFRESLSALGWAIKRSIPRVLVSDSQTIDHRRRSVVEMTKRPLVRAFDAALVGGSPHVAYLTALGFDPSACFPGCDVVDNEHFVAVSRSTRPEAPTLLSCIRLLPRKNVRTILGVLGRAKEWHWKIAGDGPDRAAIERRVSELGLGDRVEMLGHVEYEDLPSLYASADVYLQPSLSEPWGLAVNEAMAASLPVIVSERCGCRADLVKEGLNGSSFDPTDPSTLESVLAGMLNARERWVEMGGVSAEIISSWGLDLYATNLVRACEKALVTRGRTGLIARTVGRLL